MMSLIYITANICDTYLNHSMRWWACPPWRQVWHQVNHDEKWLSFLLWVEADAWPSPVSSCTDVFWVVLSHPDGVPMCTRHNEHRGSGLRQLGHACICVRYRLASWISWDSKNDVDLIHAFNLVSKNYLSKKSDKDLLPSIFVLTKSWSDTWTTNDDTTLDISN